MHDEPDYYGGLDDITDCARAAEDAHRRLARLTIDRPRMTPADIDGVLAQLAGAIAALPQAVAQLGDMLENAHDGFDLTMDDMTAAADPAQAIDVAWLHLDAIREPAVEIYRHLDAAHQWTAHIVANDRIDDVAEDAAPVPRRPERRHADDKRSRPAVRPVTLDQVYSIVCYS